MAGSLLKNFKNDLKKNDLLQSQKKKLRTGQNYKDRRERDRKVMASIRDAFNPFDVKTTKTRFQTAGQKGQTARTGISKQIGEEQRRKAYQAQKQIKNKIGGVLDRRFGQNDKSLTEEDRMVARYAKEKLRQTRKSQFSLEGGEDEVLTHGGNALAFDDFDEADLQGNQLDDDLSTKDRPARDSAVQESMGLGYDDDDDEGEDPEGAPERKKSKHQVMQEVIQKSKMHKALRQNEKAELDNMVDELNDPEAFNALMADLNTFDNENNPQKTTSTDAQYDMNLREMVYDRRAVPGVRTKTEEELEEEAKEKAKELATARQQRMEGDDLGDDLDVENDAQLFGLHDSDGNDSDGDNDSDEIVEQVETSNIPTNVSDLKNAIKSNPVRELNKLIKLNDPSKGEGNKARLGKLIQLTCKYAVYNGAHFNVVLPIIRKYADNYADQLGLYFRQEVDKIHSRSGELKTADLYTFTLIGCLFSTSDQWHLVANAATLVITQRLFQQVSTTTASVASNIYLCQVLLMYQRIAKRYIPEVCAYLIRALSAVEGTPEISTLVRLAKGTIALNESKFKTVKPSQLSLASLSKISNERLVLEMVQTVDSAADLWKSSEAYAEIFSPLKFLVESLPENTQVSQVTSKLDKKLKFFAAERKPLRLQELRPVSIVTQAPLFDDNFNPEAKFRDMDPEKRELAKMKSELKRERKSTLKEIRRDAQFESRQKSDEKRKEASEYHSMLARLTDQIQNEEGAEKNRYEREKLKRKRR